MKERFKVLVSRKNEFVQWALHNIIFGLAGVWMPFLVLILFGRLRTKEIFTDGSLLVFTVTLSAVSLGFFIKETRINLRIAHTLTYAILMITMIMSVLGLTALCLAPIFAASTPPLPLNMPCVYTGTVALVFMAVFSNFRLFLTELTVSQIDVIAEKYNAPADKLALEAKAATSADGVRL